MSTTIGKAAPTSTRLSLEEPAQAFADATANPPFLYDLGPEKGREVVNATQAGEIAKPDVTDEWINVAGGPNGDVAVHVVRPAAATGTLPVILYIHGAGWVFGNAGTHDRLVRELAVGAGAAAVFPEYSLVAGYEACSEVLNRPQLFSSRDSLSYGSHFLVPGPSGQARRRGQAVASNPN
jgi:hypothetical protein